MEVQELRELGAAELRTKISQWKEENFRLKFRAQTAEIEDTSTIRKLRRNIARALTILKEQELGIKVVAKTAAKPATVDAPQDVPTKKATRKSTKEKE